MTLQPTLDVLICAHNEEANIARLLDSLRNQSADADSFRILIVDNASTDGTRRAVERSAHGMKVRYLHEPRLGLNRARNTGYRNAQAAYVAHIDADATAHPQWIETALSVIHAERPDLCGGPYFARFAAPKPRWFLDRYNSNDLGDRPRRLGENEFLSGTNMIWRRSVVERLGGFSTSIGLTGRDFARGDETNLMLRAYKQLADFKVCYDPGMIVYHLTRPETTSLWYWVRRSFAAGRHHNTVWSIHVHDRSRIRLLGLLFHNTAATAVRCLAGLLVRDRTAYPHWQNYIYEHARPEIYRIGRLWEAVAGGKGRSNSPASLHEPLAQ